MSNHIIYTQDNIQDENVNVESEGDIHIPGSINIDNKGSGSLNFS